MKTLDAIIVDDEELGRKNLEQLLLDYCPEVRVAGKARSVVEARQLVLNFRPEIVFLDIHMPQATGFDLLESLENRDFATIFVTAYRDFGIKALKAGALDYIMKPVDFRELQLAVNKAFRRARDKHNEPPALASRIIIHLAEGSFILQLSEIRYVQAENNYSEFFLNTGRSKIVSMTLGKVQSNYPLKGFFRISNSVLVNLLYVKSYSKIGGKTLTMNDGKEFPISRRRYGDFEEALRLYVS